jgi:hypothetical protein
MEARLAAETLCFEFIAAAAAAVDIRIMVYWDMTPCTVMEIYVNKF